MKTFDGVDDLMSAVGTHLGWSSWHSITQQRIDTFAEATGDRQWIHVDPDRARAGPFGSTVAHGYLTLSMIPLLVDEVFELVGVSLCINYGSNRLRFPAPVLVNSRIRAGVELVSLTETKAGHQLVTRVTVECQENSKPVCVDESLTVIISRTTTDL